MLIQPQMIILDIVAQYPQTDPIFREYDDIIGKCLLCSHLFNSIESVTKEYQLNQADMLQKLNEAAQNPDTHEESPQEVK